MKKCTLLILAFVLMINANESYIFFLPCMVLSIFILLYILYDVLIKRTYKYFNELGIMTNKEREKEHNNALSNFTNKEIQNEYIRRFSK